MVDIVTFMLQSLILALIWQFAILSVVAMFFYAVDLHARDARARYSH